MIDSLKPTEKYERNGWPSLPRPDIKPPKGWSLALLTACERIRSHRLSPDGTRIAFIKDGEMFSDLYSMPVTGGWPKRMTHGRELIPFWEDEIPQWSPDSQWLALSLDGHVQIVPAAGGLPRKLSDFTDGAFAPRWLPDSQRLVVGATRHEADQLLLTDIHGAWPRALSDSAEGDHWDAQPAPDGQSLAFTLRRFDDLNRMDIALHDLSSGETRRLYGQPKVRAWMPRWSPDGQWLAFICQQGGYDDLWRIRPDGSELEQVTRLGLDIASFAWSPDGKLIALTVMRMGALDLGFWDLAARQYVELRRGLGAHANPNWAPDGSFLTFEYESPVQPPDLYRLELASGEVTQLTFSTPPALAANKLVEPEIITYPSFDGLEIPAFLFRPVQSNGAAVLYPHGGPSAPYAAEWDVLAQYLVAKGYTYLAPNYRGSTGFGVAFEHANYGDWGGGDMQDCLHGAKFLRSLPGIDPARIAILGGSYGGYLTNCCLARDPEYLFACGIAKYGDANLVSSWAQCKRVLRLYSEIFLGHPATQREAYVKGSPIYQVANVQKPLLLLHGLLDEVVPPEASEEWAQALKQHNKVFEYKTYANEAHGFLHHANLLDIYERIERFLDWYLLPGSNP